MRKAITEHEKALVNALACALSGGGAIDMTNRVAEAAWCGCGREAFIHLSDRVVCPFCFLAQMVEAGFLEIGRACCMEALLEARRAEENLRLTSIVFGGRGLGD